MLSLSFQVVLSVLLTVKTNGTDGSLFQLKLIFFRVRFQFYKSNSKEFMKAYERLNLSLVPPRGHPDSAAILAARNSHNSEAYKNLSDDQSECLTKRVFHALGGYPDYSAIATENLDTESPNEIVVPEVPTLEADDEARLRPVYDSMFDHDKIARDKATSLDYRSAQSLDSRSLQMFNKQKNQVSFWFSF